jgi:hypothetical protein
MRGPFCFLIIAFEKQLLLFCLILGLALNSHPKHETSKNNQANASVQINVDFQGMLIDLGSPREQTEGQTVLNAVTFPAMPDMNEAIRAVNPSPRTPDGR